MAKRSMGLTTIGYGLLIVCGLWLISYLIALVMSLFSISSALNSPLLGIVFSSISEFQRHALILWIFYFTLLIGFVAVLQLKEWGRRLVIVINAIICIYILSRAVFVRGEVEILVILTVIIYISVIIFFNLPRIKRQFLETSIGGGRRILIVDDDKGFLKMVKKKLSSRGFDILTAVTGEQGLQVAKRRKPDLIVLDVILPGIKGREVCARLKRDIVTQDIPVIFLTAKDSPDDVRAEIEAGAVTHITKPFDSERLITEIKKVLDM